MMDRVKWFTQRVTGLLLTAIGVFVIPFMLAKIVQVTGLLKYIDGMYSSNLLLWFWVCLVISRAVFAGGWYWLFDKTWGLGEEYGFWWFKKDPWLSRDEEKRDKSGMIFGIIAIIICVLFVTELAIRVYTGTFPPYLPPR